MHRVRALLMGGQACILYGGAEFSRDTDIALHASEENLQRLTEFLRDLDARRIAVPPFQLQFLQKGHAIHFRSYHPEALRIRIDVMSVMRGVDDFDSLWNRRTHLTLPQGGTVDVLSLPDLVKSKKTQRDKDWPMIRRLLESDFVTDRSPSDQKISFWLRESRTAPMLIDLAQQNKLQTTSLVSTRPLLEYALTGDVTMLESSLEFEQRSEREADRLYWVPLVRELEDLRGKGYDSEEQV